MLPRDEARERPNSTTSDLNVFAFVIPGVRDATCANDIDPRLSVAAAIGVRGATERLRVMSVTGEVGSEKKAGGSATCKHCPVEGCTDLSDTFEAVSENERLLDRTSSDIEARKGVSARMDSLEPADRAWTGGGSTYI